VKPQYWRGKKDTSRLLSIPTTTGKPSLSDAIRRDWAGLDSVLLATGQMLPDLAEFQMELMPTLTHPRSFFL
jgi:hypothetical protein